MAKGMFTQGVAVLFDAVPTLESLVAMFPTAEVVPASDAWELSGPSLRLPLPASESPRGRIAIDIVERRWPDDMGDPKQSPTLFAAWSMGHFGPLTYPGNLERAQQQNWSCPDAEELVASHRAFVRIRSSYAYGAAPNDAVFPDDYDPLGEIAALSDLVAVILQHENALAYFNPGGEILCGRESFADILDFNREHEQPPLELWTNVRMWKPREGELLMDTVGMGQLDQPDLEALFETESVDPDDVARFLRNLSIYVATKQPKFKDGHTTDGPGGVWAVELLDKPGMLPPRDVLRWSPMA